MKALLVLFAGMLSFSASAIQPKMYRYYENIEPRTSTWFDSFNLINNNVKVPEGQGFTYVGFGVKFKVAAGETYKLKIHTDSNELNKPANCTAKDVSDTKGEVTIDFDADVGLDNGDKCTYDIETSKGRKANIYIDAVS